MEVAEFQALREQAAELFDSQGAKDKHKLSLDAIFQALVAQQGSVPKRNRKSPGDPPAWFNDTYKRLKGSGEMVNVSRFLMLAGKFPAARPEALKTGQWLRQVAGEPIKRGGNKLFQM